MEAVNTLKPLQRRYQGIPAEERQRERRQRLLQAAEEVFGEQGFKQATMRDICGRARLSDRYFYESFRNVEEVFEAVYLRISDELIQRIATAMATAPARPEALVTAGLRAFFQFIREDARRAQVLLIDAVHAGQATPAQQRGDNGAPVFHRVVNLIGSAFTHNSQQRLNGRLLASGLVGMAVHTTITWVHDGFSMSVDDMLDYNLYAWRGLRDWIAEAEAPQDSTAPSPQHVAEGVIATFNTGH